MPKKIQQKPVKLSTRSELLFIDTGGGKSMFAESEINCAGIIIDSHSALTLSKYDLGQPGGAICEGFRTKSPGASCKMRVKQVVARPILADGPKACNAEKR